MSRYLFLITVSLIFAMGVLMIFNTSSAEILDSFSSKSLHNVLIKQLCYAILGISAAIAVNFVGYRFLIRFSFGLFCILVLLLIAVFLPVIGRSFNGAHRWIGMFGLTFQPSEFVKIVIPLYYVHFFSKHGAAIPAELSGPTAACLGSCRSPRTCNGLNAFTDFVGGFSLFPAGIAEHGDLNFKSFLKLGLILFVPIFLVFLEPDNGTIGVIVISLLPLLLVTRVKWRYWVLPVCILLTVGSIVAMNLPYVTKRLQVYLNPELDIRGAGHQPYQAKIATGSGGLLGKGVGESFQKLNYLPEAQSDYIAAIYAEEFGFVGVLTLIFLYMLFSYLGFYIAYTAKDREGFLVAMSLTFLIALQAFLNLGVVSGLLPSTGMNLPFFSRGGTSLMANLICVGIIFNVGVDRWKKKGL